jgi:hypothetical protein
MILSNAADDPEGKFNDHLRTKQGKSSRLIRTVRGRLCWLLMQMVTHPRVQDYQHIFEIVEKFATEENLYVRQHATVPMIELARRRFAKVDANTRFMSDQLANRIKTLALRMVDENIAYPVVLEWVAHVIWYIQDLDHGTALKILKQLLSIDQSEAANDISSMMIYSHSSDKISLSTLTHSTQTTSEICLRTSLQTGADTFERQRLTTSKQSWIVAKWSLTRWFRTSKLW